MIDPAEYGPVLRHQWLAHLRDIGDMSLQRHTWLNSANSNPHWSFVEFVCSYPEGGQLEAGHKEGWLQADEVRILRDFGAVLDAYHAPLADDYDHKAILADPAWHAVAKAAQAACAELLAVVEDTNGRAALLERNLPF